MSILRTKNNTFFFKLLDYTMVWIIYIYKKKKMNMRLLTDVAYVLCIMYTRHNIIYYYSCLSRWVVT